MIETKFTPKVNMRRALSNAGTAKDASGASFAEDLGAWLKKQETFKTKTALATAIGTNRVSVRFWLAGRAFPRDEYCEKLHTITGLNCFGSGREAARAEHERLIPPELKKDRKARYVANADLFRKRSRDSWRKNYEGQRQFVTAEELAFLRADPRERKNVCRDCGEILHDISPHLWPSHKLTVEQYKEKWGFLRSRNATRSESTNQKQSAAMKRKRHQPPKWTRDRLPDAQRASLRTNRPGTARLEERLNARGKILGARPQFWKPTGDGDVVTDAKIAQLRLRGMSLEKIAAAVGMTLAPVFQRLKRMGFPKRARVFLHGEPVGWKQFRVLCSDFILTDEEAAKRLSVSKDWTRRKLKPKRKGEALSLELAKKLLKVRAELTVDFRRKPAGPQGGRPKQLTPSEKAELPAKYNALRAELKAFRSWLRDQDETTMPPGAVWKWLCERFRARTFSTLQLWPQLFSWLEKDYNLPTFRQAFWVPRDLAIEFLSDDYGASEDTIAGVLSHAPKPLRSVVNH
jgi:hypothetical protein